MDLKKGWGRRETLGVVSMPIILIFVFLLMTALTLVFSSVAPNAIREFALTSTGIGVALMCVFSYLIFSEVFYFRAFPATVLTVFDNREFSLGDSKSCIVMPAGTFLRYTLHYPPFDMQGGASCSELDLVVRDGEEVVAVHKLIAHRHNGCWKHAKSLSKLTGLPLKRIPLKADGSRFPPPINWPKSNV